jgi:hypothetical protein
VVYIPDQIDKEPTTHSLQVGTINAFVSTAPTISVGVQFTASDGAPRSGVACQVTELPDRTDLQTDGSGVLSVDVPITLDAINVTLADDGSAYVVRLGHMDPIDTCSGMFKRLQNLGYIDPRDEYDEGKMDVLRSALCLFRARQTPPPDGDPPDSTGDASDSTDDDAPCGCDDDGGDDGDAIVHAEPAVVTDDACGPECSGLSDDGVLDPAIASLLLKAHGS